MQVASYFASFGLKIDKSSVAKVDSTLDRLEARLNGIGNGGGFRLGRFSINQGKMDAALEKALAAASLKAVFNITKFDVNQTALNIALGNALDIASARNVFHISRFNVDQSHLNGQMINAMSTAARIASATTTLRPHVAGQPLGAAERGVTRRSAAAAGGIAVGLSRLYTPALGLALGGYGLSQLNQRNQQVVSAQLQSQAVVQQAGGTVQEGQQSFQWLRNEGNRIGFNYLDASGDYNKLLSGLTGAGMSVAQGQGVFKGFSELSRVNKLDRVQQQRVYRALSQVAGKNKLQSEELTGQLAESLPGAVSIFAEAYQNQLAATGKGGGKQGQEAITELLAAMKKGQVKGDILTYAGTVASQRAAPGLASASTASQAEQARYQNSVNDLAVVASNAGVEEGFARIFRTLNAGMSESNGLVKTLAEGFNEATKWGDDLLLWPQSFNRALEGRDSLVANWLGVDKTKGLISDWKQIKDIWGQLTNGASPEWLPTLQATSKELAAVLKQGAEFAQWLKTLRDAPKNGAPEASFATQPITATWQALGRFGGGVSDSIQAAKTRGKAVYDDPTSSYYQQPERYDADMKAGINRNQDLSKLQFDGIDSEIQFKKDADRAKFDEFLPRLTASPSLYSGDVLTQPIQQSMFGLFDNNPSFAGPQETTPSGQPFQDLSRYNPQTPVEIADYNKTLAMSQAEAAVTNNKVVNNFDISINVDATLAGIEIEAQAQAAAQAFSTALTGAFDQAQVNWPTK